MSADDLDDILGDKKQKADLEARFQELEREAEIDQLRREAGAPTREQPSDPGPAGRDAAAASSAAGPDPLREMKDALDGAGGEERVDEEKSSARTEPHLLVLCPHCEAKNRMSLRRVRTATPICGRCKEPLAVP